jgi:putative ABC transport system substrate-binding protein
MRRRQFIALVGGSAIFFASSGRAHETSGPVIGILGSRSPEDSAKVLDAFRKALGASGGQGPVLEYRWARGQYDQLPALAAELVDAKVALIVAFGPPAAAAAKQATATIPVVFVTGATLWRWALSTPSIDQAATLRA